MESANKMELTYTNVNGYLIPNLTYKFGEQMEQLGKYGFLRRDYLKNYRNSTYQVMLLQDTIGEHLLEVDKAARAREFPRQHFRLSVRQNKGYSFVWLRPCGYFYLFQRLARFRLQIQEFQKTVPYAPHFLSRQKKTQAIFL